MDKPSPFASHLGTNHAATGEEMVKLTEFLEGPLSRLAELKQEIDIVQARCDALLDKHKELSKEIEGHKALLAPIRRLPVDIIQEIFLRCLPHEHNAIISHRECPVLLTRICSGWRRIALNTASLWASIHIPIPTDTAPGYYTPSSWAAPTQQSQQFPTVMAIAERRARAIREWLGRSGACALSISLYDREVNTSSKIYDVILDELIPFAARWGSLVCEAPARSLTRIGRIPAEDLPQLRSLMICGSSAHGVFPPSPDLGTGGVSSAYWANSGIVRAPRLCSISYNNITEDFPRFPLRWAQLTSIALRGIAWHAAEHLSVSRAAHLLASCPLLRFCRLEIASLRQDQSHGGDTSMPGSISLPHLEHLCIHAGPTSLTCLLDALNVPALARLEFHTSVIARAPFIALLRRVAPTLRSIILDSCSFSREEFFQCLEICADLEELTLRRNYYSSQQVWTPPLADNNGWGSLLLDEVTQEPRTFLVLDDEFLRRLFAHQPEAGAVVLVPRLTKFECHISVQFSDACVLEVVRARNAAAASGEFGVTKLARVNISFGRPQQQSMIAEIEKLAEEGVDCRLSYSPPLPSSKHLPTDGIVDLSPMPWGVPLF